MRIGIGALARQIVLCAIASIGCGQAARAVTVDAGVEHACAIEAGQVYCWGENTAGQLGRRTFSQHGSTAVRVAILGDNATAVSAGMSHTCAVVDGGVQCWGINSEGELGDGTRLTRATPNWVFGLGAGSGATAVAAGLSHTCAVAAGVVRCWGRGREGQLGMGAIIDATTTPVVASLPAGVRAITSGLRHSCAIVDDAAYCWGDNAFGQLGDGTQATRASPVIVDAIDQVTAIDSTGSHTCAVSGAKAKCWGENSGGQVGDGTTAMRLVPTPVATLVGVTAIAAGNGHSCAIDGAGAAWCWGQNRFGALGDGGVTSSPLPVAVAGPRGWREVSLGGTASCGVIEERVRCWGSDGKGQLGYGVGGDARSPVDVRALPAGSGASAVAAGNAHACAVVNDGLRCWGLGDAGQLGDGAFTMRLEAITPAGLGDGSGVTAVATGLSHTCAIVDGAVRCWGDNAYGQLGDGTQVARGTPVAVAVLGDDVTAITAFRDHTCAIASGEPYCWGSNADGQLGDGTPTPQRLVPTRVAVGATTVATAIAAGAEHTCAVLDGDAWCWGSNDYSRVRPSPGGIALSPVHVDGIAPDAHITGIAAAGYHSCALVDGGAQCWGMNFFGQVGDGHSLLDGMPEPVVTPTPVVHLGAGSGVQAIVGGAFHTCALATDGARCWGYGAQGAVGDGEAEIRPLATPVNALDANAGTTSIAAGDMHACAVAAGGVKCWGMRRYGALGDGEAGFLVAPSPLHPVVLDTIAREGFE